MVHHVDYERKASTEFVQCFCNGCLNVTLPQGDPVHVGRAEFPL
jgi:hypothetical protein